MVAVNQPAVATKGAGISRSDTVLGIIVAISFCHFINDMLQSLLPAIYPNLKAALGLSFIQIGLLTLDLPGHGLGVAAGGRSAVRQAAVTRSRSRSERCSRWPDCWSSRSRTSIRCCCSARVCSGPARPSFTPKSSRVARMACGNAARVLAVALSSRRQRGIGARSPRSRRSSSSRYGQSSLALLALLALLATAVLWNVAVWYRQRRALPTARRCARDRRASTPAGSSATPGSRSCSRSCSRSISTW